MKRFDEDDVIRRALLAYCRGGGVDQPLRGGTTVQKIGGKHYATVRNSVGVLAVYSVSPGGRAAPGPRLARRAGDLVMSLPLYAAVELVGMLRVLDPEAHRKLLADLNRDLSRLARRARTAKLRRARP